MSREILRNLEASAESGRLESVAETYSRHQEDFETVLQDRLQGVDPALRRAGQLVQDVKRRVAEMEIAHTRREDTAKAGAAGVRAPPFSLFLQSQLARCAVAAMERNEQVFKAYSTRVEFVIVPTQKEVQVQHATRRLEVEIQGGVPLATIGHAQAPCSLVDPAAWLRITQLHPILEDRNQEPYLREYLTAEKTSLNTLIQNPLQWQQRCLPLASSEIWDQQGRELSSWQRLYHIFSRQ